MEIQCSNNVVVTFSGGILAIAPRGKPQEALIAVLDKDTMEQLASELENAARKITSDDNWPH